MVLGWKGTLPELAVTFAIGVGVFALFACIAAIVQTYSLKFLKRAHVNVENARFGIKILYTLIYIIGILSSLGSMGVNINAAITSLGIGGFAISFAMKDIISNVLAGLMMHIYQPFSIGDQVEVCGYEGTINEINMRYTVIHNEHGYSLIPNTKLLTNVIIVKHQASKK